MIDYCYVINSHKHCHISLRTLFLTNFFHNYWYNLLSVMHNKSGVSDRPRRKWYSSNVSNCKQSCPIELLLVSNEPLIMAPNHTLLNHIHFSWVGTNAGAEQRIFVFCFWGGEWGGEGAKLSCWKSIKYIHTYIHMFSWLVFY